MSQYLWSIHHARDGRFDTEFQRQDQVLSNDIALMQPMSTGHDIVSINL